MNGDRVAVILDVCEENADDASKEDKEPKKPEKPAVYWIDGTFLFLKKLHWELATLNLNSLGVVGLAYEVPCLNDFLFLLICLNMNSFHDLGKQLIFLILFYGTCFFLSFACGTFLCLVIRK